MSNSAEPNHSPLGPSSAKRWINCPGSVLATINIADTDKEYALEGTAAHTISEIARCENKPMSHYKGRTVGVPRLDGGVQKFIVTQEMVDSVQEFIDFCELLPGDAYFEIRVRYDQWVKSGFGTLDDVRIAEVECNITDLKYGKGEHVAAFDNEQLKMYALGVLHDYGYLYPDLEMFHLHISQPRVKPVESWSISKADLLKWAKDVVVPAAKLAMTPGAPFKAGDWCTFCKIKETCKTRANTNLDVFLEDFSEIDDVNLAKPENRVLKSQDLLSNEQVAQIGYMIDGAKKWIKDIEAYMMRSLQAGVKIGDWKLVAGRSNRKWDGSDVDVVEVLYSLTDTAGKQLVSEDDAYKKKLKGPAAIAKVIGAKHPLLRPSDSETDPGIVTKPPGKPKLAPGSDPRPPIEERDLKELMLEFDEVDEDEDE